jgi:hypothetical protein
LVLRSEETLKFLTRLGWTLIAIGAALFLSTILPAGFFLIVLGAPMVFIGHTATALRAQRGPTRNARADD